MTSKPAATLFKFPFIATKLESQQQATRDATTKPSESAATTTTTILASQQQSRPILTHLNADTTWLLLLPYPSDSNSNRKYFRILIDPWLSGPQSDYFSWFSTQWHAIAPPLRSIREVEEFISSVDSDGGGDGGGGGGEIDAVVISHEFTDHCHKATLLEIPKDVPVFANDKALEIIRGWKHFDTVVEVGKFPKAFAGRGGGGGGGGIEEWDWRKESRFTEKGLLPDWVGITRLESPGNALYYHSSVMITWATRAAPSNEINGEGESVAAECILYTPHGTVADTLESLKLANPKVEVLALMHGLHDVKLGWSKYSLKQLNLGMKNAVEAVKKCNAGAGVKYWVGTHDETKVASGVVGKVLWRKAWTAEEVVEDAVKGCYVEVGNGESLLLE
ncbi:hypothetical protein ABW20_dc0110654 [Dactylellina cionopaga]|nr:hypothetical protein ABW20_dc0110654 [Dactylellina cionopaga]